MAKEQTGEELVTAPSAGGGRRDRAGDSQRAPDWLHGADRESVRRRWPGEGRGRAGRMTYQDDKGERRNGLHCCANLGREVLALALATRRAAGLSAPRGPPRWSPIRPCRRR